MVYPTGCVYEGSFANDMRNGVGTLTIVVRGSCAATDARAGT